MSLETAIALHHDYAVGEVNRKHALQSASLRYQQAFDAAYERLMERRAAERKQFLDVIIPHIKQEASMCRYEREMDEKVSSNGAIRPCPQHEAVAGADG